MDFDTFARLIRASSWVLLDTDGIHYVVFLPVYVYLKQCCFGWRVEHQPDDCTVVPITGGYPTPGAALEAALSILEPHLCAIS